ncbi:hypothetical protein, partial [Plasmodium yoelii yoelii]
MKFKICTPKDTVINMKRTTCHFPLK